MYAGLEEAFARFISTMLTVLFFVVYIFAQNGISFDWYSGAGFLFLFWFIQEIFSVALFYTFKFFSSRKINQNIEGENQKNQEIDLGQ